MLSIRPDLTEEQIRNTLRSTATDMGAAGFDNTFGTGRLNVAAAMGAILQTISGTEPVCTSSTFTVANVPAGTAVAWSSSNTGGLTITNGGVATRVGGFNGSVTITATINAGCGNANIQRTVQVGTIQPSQVAISWQTTPFCLNEIAYFTAVDNTTGGTGPVTYYEWTVDSDVVIRSGHAEPDGTCARLPLRRRNRLSQ